MKKIVLSLIITGSCASLMGMQHKQITPVSTNTVAAGMGDVSLTHNTAVQAATLHNKKGFCDNSCDLMCGGVCVACMLCPTFCCAVGWDTAHIISDRKQQKCYPHTKEVAALCYCFLH